MEIRIDDYFRSLLWPLSDEERSQLEASIVADGCRDPLVVWNGVIVDGHNRHEICSRLGIPFGVVEMDFVDKEDAADWIDRNQAGRRNATPEQLRLIRGRIYNRQKKRVGEHEGNQHTKSERDQIEPLPKTADKVADQFGVSPATIKRDGRLAEAVEVLGITEDYTKGEIGANASEIIDAAKPIVDAKKKQPTKARPSQPEIFDDVATEDQHDKVDIEAIKETLKKPHVSRNSGDNEWYTPPEFIEAAREVLGTIDIDPASSAIANETVKAGTFYTAEQDGLAQDWPVGNIWMNPPYAQPLISRFCTRIVDEVSRGSSAIVLVNNGTETQWFQTMASACSAACFPRTRVKFLDPDGNPGAPLQGQAILYFGFSPDAFIDHFSKFGEVFYHG